ATKQLMPLDRRGAHQRDDVWDRQRGAAIDQGAQEPAAVHGAHAGADRSAATPIATNVKQRDRAAIAKHVPTNLSKRLMTAVPSPVRPAGRRPGARIPAQ